MEKEDVDVAFKAARDIRCFIEIVEQIDEAGPEKLSLCVKRDLTERQEQSLERLKSQNRYAEHDLTRMELENFMISMPCVQKAILSAARDALIDEIDAAEDRLKEAARK